MFRVFLCAMILALPGVALACDDHVGKCKLDGIRTIHERGYFKLMASSTCQSGQAFIRVFDGDKFIGVVDGYIRHHALDIIENDIPPYQSLNLKYGIEPR